MKLGVQSSPLFRNRLRRVNLITQNMTLSRTVADWGNHRHLLQIMGDTKRYKHRGDVGRAAQPDQLRELRVKRPNLEPELLVGDISPQLALDRHQTGLVRFLLQ